MNDVFLTSNFADYYDHFLASESQCEEDIEFIRNKNNKLKKNEFFTLFSRKRIDTPPYFIHKDGYHLTEEMLQKFYVVHMEEEQHNGKKLLLSQGKNLNEKHEGKICVEHTGEEGHSIRLLKAGDMTFWLEYRSSDWESNQGKHKIVKLIPRDYKLEAFERTYKDFLDKHSLVAIDFVVDKNGMLLAINYDQSPRIQDTGIEDIVPAHMMAHLITSHFYEHNSDNNIWI